MNARGQAPWRLTYSFGRALQDPALKAWGGKAANAEATQLALARRLNLAAAASQGTYNPEMEAAA
jgi:fructose-bisphosphate aldolase class I